MLMAKKGPNVYKMNVLPITEFFMQHDMSWNIKYDLSWHFICSQPSNNVESNENNTIFTSFREFFTFGVTDMKFVQDI